MLLPGFAILLGLMGLSGLVLLIVGMRGRRVDDHPICPSCRFDLAGSRADITGLCPECGGDARRPLPGKRVRKHRALLSGIGLMVLPIGVLATTGYIAISGTDPMRVAPLFYLEYRAFGNFPRPTPHRHLDAVQEILRRGSSGGLSQKTVDRLVSDILAAQDALKAHDVIDFDQWWSYGTLAQGLAGAQLLSEAQFDQLGRNGIHTVVIAREAYKPSDPLAFEVHEYGLAPVSSLPPRFAPDLLPPGDHSHLRMVRVEQIEVDGEVAYTDLILATGWERSMESGWVRLRHVPSFEQAIQINAPDEAGLHTLALHASRLSAGGLTTTFMVDSAATIVAIEDAESIEQILGNLAPALHRRRPDVVIREPTVMILYDSDAINNARDHLRQLQSRGTHIACDVWVRAGTSRYPLARMVLGEHTNLQMNLPRFIEAETTAAIDASGVESVKLVFEPNAQIAKAYVAIDEVAIAPAVEFELPWPRETPEPTQGRRRRSQP